MARTRRVLTAGCLALVALMLSGCVGDNYPNTIFNHTTDFNEAVDLLFDRMFLLGTIVFIGVEAGLIYTVIKFRRREGQTEPRHVHGNTTLEILWTAIPAVILVFLAIPTVRTIFRTQAKAPAGALEVEVVGHQWWWEFRYPQYTRTLPNGKLDTLTTANELYLPTGRTANFALKTADVLHSFGIPRLAGTRDLIANHTNYLWFTPVDSMAGTVVNGFCREYCGSSHANMKFRVYTVTPQAFEGWVAGQLQLAAAATPLPGGTPAPPAGATPPPPNSVDVPPASLGAQTPAQVDSLRAPSAPRVASYVFPKDSIPQYAVPTDEGDPSVRFDANLLRGGDATRGAQAFLAGGCVGCHVVAGNPIALGRLGPNLTHIGSRHTLAGAQFPNEPLVMARWIKNAKKMKPGSLMPTLGKGETDPITGAKQGFGLTDQQIADVVAYLQALK